MIKAVDLIEKWRYALDNRWGYIWGKYGQVWTATDQKNATREMTIKYGSQWIGHRVADCSGLGYWAFKELGGGIFHGSNTIWNQYVTGRCELKDGKRTDGEDILPGDPVFLKRTENGKTIRHHIGYYVGGKVIEAAGTRQGVIESPLSKWHETAHWKNVEYEGGVVFVGYKTLRWGSSGDEVMHMQELLTAAGYDVGKIDGKFGERTKEAVKNFQLDHGLTVDGICGDQTWAELEDGDESPDDDYREPVDNVIIPADSVILSKEDFARIRDAFAAMGAVIKKYEGV